MTIEVESPANARETAPPDRKERLHRKLCVLARLLGAAFGDLRHLVSLTSAATPILAVRPFSQWGDTIGNRYPLVMSHATREPTRTNPSTARTGHVANCKQVGPLRARGFCRT